MDQNWCRNRNMFGQ